MGNLVEWLEAHDKLAGWAQFIGAMLALLVTYLTAFAPIWRRKRELRNAGKRLLAHGYEAIESYHRTSAHFAPFPLSLRFASLTMSTIVDEMGRFPIYELEDQGGYSLARRLVSMGATLSGLKLFLDTAADDLGDQQATSEEHENIRTFVGERLVLAEALITGAKLERPIWPIAPDAKPNAES